MTGKPREGQLDVIQAHYALGRRLLRRGRIEAAVAAFPGCFGVPRGLSTSP